MIMTRYPVFCCVALSECLSNHDNEVWRSLPNHPKRAFASTQLNTNMHYCPNCPEHVFLDETKYYMKSMYWLVTLIAEITLIQETET